MLASIPILTGSKLRHEKTPPALCQMHNAGGIPVSSDLIFSRQGTVHKVALFILRSRENSVHSVEKLTGQHTPYTFPIITEQCNGYSLSGNASRFSQRLIQKGGFALFPRDIKGSRIDNDDRFALFVGISHGIPGTAGASIPYCKNIIGVIYHVPISLVHAVRRVLPLQHGLLVTLCSDIVIPFP